MALKPKFHEVSIFDEIPLPWNQHSSWKTRDLHDAFPFGMATYSSCHFYFRECTIYMTRWWFQIFFISMPIVGKWFPIWLKKIFFRWVEPWNHQLYEWCIPTILCVHSPPLRKKTPTVGATLWWRGTPACWRKWPRRLSRRLRFDGWWEEHGVIPWVVRNCGCFQK